MKTIEECDGYKSLLKAVEKDEAESPKFHDYRGKLKWVLERARHYAEKTGLDAADILDSWERCRSYWYMNYYQDCNQPEIKSDNIRVFKTTKELKVLIGEDGFRCPKCEGVSKSPYECTQDGCDWKAYGLFRTLGKGIHVFVKEAIRSEEIFMPIAWENNDKEQGDSSHV